LKFQLKVLFYGRIGLKTLNAYLGAEAMNTEMTVFSKLFTVKLGLAAAILIGVATLGGCDFVAQQELKAGVSTADDVKKFMGKPEMVWEEKDGTLFMEFPRSPEGHQTYVVEIGSDGKYKGMKNILTDESFAKIQVGQTQDDVRRTLGKPSEQVQFKLKNEVVWSWKFSPSPGKSEIFNVHFNPEGKVKTTSKSVDPRTMEGG
jgi:SmpA / OmlA family